MKQIQPDPLIIDSISTLHRVLQLPKAVHPFISVIEMSTIGEVNSHDVNRLLYQFYSICIKKDFKGKMKYGQQYVDFDEGVLTFFSPGQIVSTETSAEDNRINGWWLVIHPDFLRTYPLGNKMMDYGFFSYAVHEALHLSEVEEQMITTLMQQIADEYNQRIDEFSHDLIVSQIELLLNYANRFYKRQFITRKLSNHDVVKQVNDCLAAYFNDADSLRMGLPTVQYIASKMNMSPSYLSDTLRSYTGQNTQQLIHQYLIEAAKQQLAGTRLTVSEIAYQLGFEHPQSFNKLFKNKTNLSPLAFRQSFN